MKKRFHYLLPAFATILLLLMGCEYETEAYGRVSDKVTGLPIEGARVMEFAIEKKTQAFVMDAHTDSAGTFRIDGGLYGAGLKRVRMILLIESDGYFPKS